FSSRRRHTRWPRDWSSDVCSSDLDNICQYRDHDTDPTFGVFIIMQHGGDSLAARFKSRPAEHGEAVRLLEQAAVGLDYLHRKERSEERRVGKAGRSRWEMEDQK